ncbi:MAG TPA: hypothetical protein PLN14_07620 [Candidatus Hydrothermia bacterium]|nr:hypothetical protein [Candidatus Hydrothermia bacterium]HRD21066.1 hypothetical protein [Fervidobacterium sp.]
MTKQNKNRKDQTTLKQMVKSVSQLIMKHDEGKEQPVNEMMQDDQFANEFHYKSCGTSLEDLGRSQRK